MDFERMLRYCSLLEQNNNRTWFHDSDNYQLYTAAKQDFIELVEELKYRIADLTTPDLAERLIFVDAKSLLYRIPRDMRTNKGKPPYKPRWSADISAGRHTTVPIGYYVHIQPGDRSMFGTGAWCEDSDSLQRVRSYISENAERFLDALEHCSYPLIGNRLKNVLRGFDPLDPVAEYLKHKDWLTIRQFPDSALQDFQGFLNEAAEAAERMEPLRQFFNDAFTGRRKNPFDPMDWE